MRHQIDAREVLYRLHAKECFLDIRAVSHRAVIRQQDGIKLGNQRLHSLAKFGRPRQAILSQGYTSQADNDLGQYRFIQRQTSRRKAG
jgi:hypothetical protein